MFSGSSQELSRNVERYYTSREPLGRGKKEKKEEAEFKIRKKKKKKRKPTREKKFTQQINIIRKQGCC